MELVEFLLARIAEDEASDGWHTVNCGVGLGYWATGECVCKYPTRVLAECDAKRRIVAAYLDERTRRDIYWAADEADLNDDDRSRRWSTTARTRGLEIAVEALVLPYADHPDYDEAWRP